MNYDEKQPTNNANANPFEQKPLIRRRVNKPHRAPKKIKVAPLVKVKPQDSLSDEEKQIMNLRNNIKSIIGSIDSASKCDDYLLPNEIKALLDVLPVIQGIRDRIC